MASPPRSNPPYFFHLPPSAPSAAAKQPSLASTSNAKAKRAFGTLDVPMQDAPRDTTSGKRDRTIDKKEISTDSLFASLLEACDQDRYAFDPAKFRAFHPKWDALITELFDKTEKLHSRLVADMELKEATQARQKEKKATFSDEAATLLAFHLAIFPKLRKTDEIEVAFTEHFIHDFAQLEPLFAALLPNYVQFIQEKEALVSALSIASQIVDSHRKSLPELCAAFYEDGRGIATFRHSKEIELGQNNLFSQFFARYADLTPLEKGIARQSFAVNLVPRISNVVAATFSLESPL